MPRDRKRQLEPTWRIGSTSSGECVYFLSGFCRLGNACPFSHGVAAAASEAVPEEAPQPKKLKTISTKVTDQRAVRKIRTEECSICLETLSKPKMDPIAKLTKCKHLFHARCITEWMEYREKCPLCDTQLTVFP